MGRRGWVNVLWGRPGRIGRTHGPCPTCRKGRHPTRPGPPTVFGRSGWIEWCKCWVIEYSDHGHCTTPAFESVHEMPWLLPPRGLEANACGRIRAPSPTRPRGWESGHPPLCRALGRAPGQKHDVGPGDLSSQEGVRRPEACCMPSIISVGAATRPRSGHISTLVRSSLLRNPGLQGRGGGAVLRRLMVVIEKWVAVLLRRGGEPSVVHSPRRPGTAGTAGGIRIRPDTVDAEAARARARGPTWWMSLRRDIHPD